MLNEIHEKGMSNDHRVKVNNFRGSTSATILENIDQLVKIKPDCLTVRAGTNDLVNGQNLLNQAKKLVRQVIKVFQNTKIVFSSVIIWKPGKNIDKKVSQLNSYLKKYCNLKIIDLIDKGNLKEERFSQKKLHLNNSVLANDLLKYLRSNF